MFNGQGKEHQELRAQLFEPVQSSKWWNMNNHAMGARLKPESELGAAQSYNHVVSS